MTTIKRTGRKPVKTKPRKPPLRKPSKPKDDFFTIKADKVTALLQEIENKFDIVSNAMVSRDRVSTGLLCLDYVWNGGVLPGMYQISGQEKSGKTTLCLTAFGNIYRQNIPLNVMRDAEGTTGGDLDYAEKLYGESLDSIRQNGNVRISMSNVIEDTYDYFKAILRRFPDKVYSGEDGCWYYRAPDTKIGQQQMQLIDAPATALVKKDKKLYIKAPSRIEGLAVIDSYAAMVTRGDDESDTKTKQAAPEATAFSDNIKLIIARLATKGFTIIGTNQIRENPRAMFGSPVYEPGGNALKFYSSVRDRVSAISPSSLGVCAKGALFTRSKQQGMTSAIEEPSVEVSGKTDFYQLAKIQNIKNKNGPPYLLSYYRVWFRDGRGKGRGICPVFDCWQFMELQGLGKYKAKKLISPWWDNKPLTWQQFKTLVLAETTGDKRLVQLADKIKFAPKDIRARCFDYIRKGKLKNIVGDPSEEDRDNDRTTRV